MQGRQGGDMQTWPGMTRRLCLSTQVSSLGLSRLDTSCVYLCMCVCVMNPMSPHANLAQRYELWSVCVCVCMERERDRER